MARYEERAERRYGVPIPPMHPDGEALESPPTKAPLADGFDDFDWTDAAFSKSLDPTTAEYWSRLSDDLGKGRHPTGLAFGEGIRALAHRLYEVEAQGGPAGEAECGDPPRWVWTGDRFERVGEERPAPGNARKNRLPWPCRRRGLKVVGDYVERRMNEGRLRKELPMSEVTPPTSRAGYEEIEAFWKALVLDLEAGLHPEPSMLSAVLVGEGLPSDMGEYLELRLQDRGRPPHRPKLSSAGLSTTEEKEIFGPRRPPGSPKAKVSPAAWSYLAEVRDRLTRFLRSRLNRRDARAEAVERIARRYGVAETSVRDAKAPGLYRRPRK